MPRAKTSLTWSDGTPVYVGQTAMSLIGPMRIDGIEICQGDSWRLWANVSWMGSGEKWLYIIDEGEHDAHPTREGEECEFWQEGDDTMPHWVFAPKKLSWDER